MWVARSASPFPADRAWVRDKTGRHHWIVALKATFDVDERGQLKVAEEQPIPELVPQWNGEDFVSSLRCESDLTALRPATDVVVHGCAHAPNGRPVAEVPIGLRVGRVQKTLVVRGDAVFHTSGPTLSTTTPAPFVKMPVTYERAFGGMDVSNPDPSQQKMDGRNPVGRGVATTLSKLQNTPAPNVFFPGKDMQTAGPAGFGAIAAHWSPRVEHQGTYDAKWEATKKPLLADDWHPRALLTAPPDQQVGGYLEGGEAVEVVHMNERGVLKFAIPQHELRLKTSFGSNVREHGGLLVSVFVEPDPGRVTLLWQSSLLVPPADIEYLDETEASISIPSVGV